MTKYIYFDLGRVLLDFDHGLARTQLAELTGVDEHVVQDLIFDDGLLVEFETGRIDERQFYDRFCESTGKSPALSDFLLAYSDIFTPIQPMVAVVEQLASLHVPIGILSNTSAAHWHHVCDGRFEFLPHRFRDLVLSYEVGEMKPDRGIYKVAIEKAGVEPKEIFFCDDREENVEGATNAGLDAVLFESPTQIADQIGKRIESFDMNVV